MLVPDNVVDLQFGSYENVRRFAEAQKATVANFEVEVVPGLIAGQKAIPVDTAACYIPGGRYNHIASAIMTVTTAKVAGCNNIIACSPPRRCRDCTSHHYAAHICGADKIPRNGRGAGGGIDDLRFLWFAKGKYSCGSGQSICR